MALINNEDSFNKINTNGLKKKSEKFLKGGEIQVPQRDTEKKKYNT